MGTVEPEFVGITKDGLVAVGRGQNQGDARTDLKMVATDFHRLCCDPAIGDERCVDPQDFIYGGG